MLQFTCEPTPLPSVSVAGPCTSSVTVDGAYVAGESAGTCHVVLTFATGFVFATDVTFTEATSYVCGMPSCGSCGQITTPGSSPVGVDNPGSTCQPLDASE
jgi:hypothetical protein